MAKVTAGEGVDLLSRQARSRRKLLTRLLDGAELPVLEVGALNDPTFRKPEGDVWFADYFTREESVAQNVNNLNRPADRMVEVDFVLRDRSLSEAVTIQSGLLIANHVIEHLPDPIRWLQEAHKVSKPKGLLFMAVPDRRYTFDYFKPVSDAVDWIAAYDACEVRPTRYQILRSLYYQADLRTAGAWAGNIPSDHLRRFTMAEAMKKASELAQTYTDVHCWVFTHESFLRIMSDLSHSGLLPWTVIHSEGVEPNNNEFRVLLRAT